MDPLMKGGEGRKGVRSFQCQLCRQEFRTDFLGRRPPYCPQLVFTEDVFCVRDPFVSRAIVESSHGSCLPTVVGGVCSVCGLTVCTECSLFYTTRVCGPCAQRHRSVFPQELQAVIATLVRPGNVDDANRQSRRR
ncbi:unnamed protein product [Discosporangium mesarthrocarpum]